MTNLQEISKLHKKHYETCKLLDNAINRVRDLEVRKDGIERALLDYGRVVSNDDMIKTSLYFNAVQDILGFDKEDLLLKNTTRPYADARKHLAGLMRDNGETTNTIAKSLLISQSSACYALKAHQDMLDTDVDYCKIHLALKKYIQ